MKVRMTMSKIQAELIVDALDLFLRLPQGQLEEIVSFFRMHSCKRRDGSDVTSSQIEEFRNTIAFAKEQLLDFPSGGNFSIGSKDVPDWARTAYDLLRSIRSPLAQKGYPKEDRPMWTDVRCDPVNKMGTERLARVELLSDPPKPVLKWLCEIDDHDHDHPYWEAPSPYTDECNTPSMFRLRYISGEWKPSSDEKLKRKGDHDRGWVKLDEAKMYFEMMNHEILDEIDLEHDIDPIQQYYDLKAQHGWAGTIFCRCDAEDRLGRKMAAEEWEKVRSSYPWRKTIGDILCERGLEIIDSALYEAGLEREVDDG